MMYNTGYSLKEINLKFQFKSVFVFESKHFTTLQEKSLTSFKSNVTTSSDAIALL